MAIANLKVTLDYDIKTVWDKVTSLKNCKWRSDLSKIEILEKGKFFAEYTKSGFKTTFTITAFAPYERYEFDMKNENMEGHWTGKFSQVGEKTVIDFTEDVTAKKWYMKPLVLSYLKKQQILYANDLKKALEE